MGLLDDFLGTNSADATNAAASNAADTLYGASTAANRAVNQGALGAQTALTQGAGAATGAINSLYGGARNDLVGYGNQAQGLLSQGVGNAVNTVQGSNAAYSPYISGGGGASNMLSNALGLNGPQGNATATAAFSASPGYQYSVDQATDAAARKAASLGMSASGNTLDAITRLGSNLANQDWGNWLQNLSGLGSQGLTAANSVSNNNQAAGGYQYGGASTGAGLLSSLGLNLGNLGTAQGNALAGIETGLGNSLAGVSQNRGQELSSNLMGTANNVANYGMLAGQAQDSADNTNAGILSKLIGGATGLLGGGSSGFTVAPGANGTFSVVPSSSSGGLLSSAIGKVKGYL